MAVHHRSNSTSHRWTNPKSSRWTNQTMTRLGSSSRCLRWTSSTRHSQSRWLSRPRCHRRHRNRSTRDPRGERRSRQPGDCPPLRSGGPWDTRRRGSCTHPRLRIVRPPLLCSRRRWSTRRSRRCSLRPASDPTQRPRVQEHGAPKNGTRCAIQGGRASSDHTDPGHGGTTRELVLRPATSGTDLPQILGPRAGTTRRSDGHNETDS